MLEVHTLQIFDYYVTIINTLLNIPIHTKHNETNTCTHVKYLKTNCLKALDILKVVGHTNWGADQKTLLCLCQALVRSKLDYGCTVYGAASNNILKKLDPNGYKLLLELFVLPQ